MEPLAGRPVSTSYYFTSATYFRTVPYRLRPDCQVFSWGDFFVGGRRRGTSGDRVVRVWAMGVAARSGLCHFYVTWCAASQSFRALTVSAGSGQAGKPDLRGEAVSTSMAGVDGGSRLPRTNIIYVPVDSHHLVTAPAPLACPRHAASIGISFPHQVGVDQQPHPLAAPAIHFALGIPVNGDPVRGIDQTNHRQHDDQNQPISSREVDRVPAHAVGIDRLADFALRPRILGFAGIGRGTAGLPTLPG